MKNYLSAIAPIISVVHVFVSLTFYLLEIELTVSLFAYVGLPVITVVLIHIAVVIFDKNTGITERIAYGLIHIPFCVVFSVSSLLLFSLSQQKHDTQQQLEQCKTLSESKCLSHFYVNK